jgi:hypothetical protein
MSRTYRLEWLHQRLEPTSVHYLWFAIAVGLLNVYGCLIPLRYRPLSSGEALAEFRWCPRLIVVPPQGSHKLLTNGGLRHEVRSPRFRPQLIVRSRLATRQQSAWDTTSRHPSTTDLVIERFGAWLGYAATRHALAALRAEGPLSGRAHEFCH